MYTFEYTNKRQNADPEDAHENVKLSIVNWIARKNQKNIEGLTFFKLNLFSSMSII